MKPTLTTNIKFRTMKLLLKKTGKIPNLEKAKI